VLSIYTINYVKFKNQLTDRRTNVPLRIFLLSFHWFHLTDLFLGHTSWTTRAWLGCHSFRQSIRLLFTSKQIYSHFKQTDNHLSVLLNCLYWLINCEFAKEIFKTKRYPS